MGISMNSGCQGLGSMAALCKDLQYGEKQVDRQQAALLKLSQTVENTGRRERCSEQASGPCGNLSHLPGSRYAKRSGSSGASGTSLFRRHIDGHGWTACLFYTSRSPVPRDSPEFAIPFRDQLQLS